MAIPYIDYGSTNSLKEWRMEIEHRIDAAKFLVPPANYILFLAIINAEIARRIPQGPHYSDKCYPDGYFHYKP